MTAAGEITEIGAGMTGATPASQRPRFTWRYDHKLDSQGRVPLPAKWRPEDPSSLSLMAVMIRHQQIQQHQRQRLHQLLFIQIYV